MPEQEFEMSDGGGGSANSSTVCLRLVHKNHNYSEDGSVEIRYYLIDDLDEEFVDLKKTCPKFVSPVDTLLGSSMAAVGNFLYIAGGSREVDYYEDDIGELICNYDRKTLVRCIGTSGEARWTDLEPLLRPRDNFLLVPSVAGDKLYAIGDTPPRADPPGDPHLWAEVFDIKCGKWSPHMVEPPGDCKSLPWIVYWYIQIPNSSNDHICFLGFDYYGSRSFKLYGCDLVQKKCYIIDDEFLFNFVGLHRPSMSDYILIMMTVQNKPAQRGDLLYFAGSDAVYCYNLKQKLWLPEAVGGLNVNKDIGEYSCYWYRTQIVYLGGNGEKFALLCYNEEESCIARWAEFQISIYDCNGIQTATACDLSGIKKFNTFFENFGAGSVDCFAIAIPHDVTMKKRKKRETETRRVRFMREAEEESVGS